MIIPLIFHSSFRNINCLSNAVDIFSADRYRPVSVINSMVQINLHSAKLFDTRHTIDGVFGLYTKWLEVESLVIQSFPNKFKWSELFFSNDRKIPKAPGTLGGLCYVREKPLKNDPLGLFSFSWTILLRF
jgi:hypothetical protein